MGTLPARKVGQVLKPPAPQAGFPSRNRLLFTLHAVPGLTITLENWLPFTGRLWLRLRSEAWECYEPPKHSTSVLIVMYHPITRRDTEQHKIKPIHTNHKIMQIRQHDLHKLWLICITMAYPPLDSVLFMRNLGLQWVWWFPQQNWFRRKLKRGILETQLTTHSEGEPEDFPLDSHVPVQKLQINAESLDPLHTSLWLDHSISPTIVRDKSQVLLFFNHPACAFLNIRLRGCSWNKQTGLKVFCLQFVLRVVLEAESWAAYESAYHTM